MLGIKVANIGRGSHSSEVIVTVDTADGTREELIVDSRSIKNNVLAVGYPVGAKDENYLIELPRETMRGVWRIWVNKSSLLRLNEEIPA